MDLHPRPYTRNPTDRRPCPLPEVAAGTEARVPRSEIRVGWQKNDWLMSFRSRVARLESSGFGLWAWGFGFCVLGFRASWAEPATRELAKLYSVGIGNDGYPMLRCPLEVTASVGSHVPNWDYLSDLRRASYWGLYKGTSFAKLPY